MTEVVLPTEHKIPTARYALSTKESNKDKLIHDLDTIDDIRDIAKTRTTSYQPKVSNNYNKNVRIRTFKESDLVLRKVFPNTIDTNAGKFTSTREGP